jgi:hypothetical protein
MIEKMPLINPISVSFSDNPEEQLAYEARWMLDPPTGSEQLSRILEAIANSQDSKNTKSLLFEKELNRRFIEMQRERFVREFRVENATSQATLDKGFAFIVVTYVIPKSTRIFTLKFQINLDEL